MACLEHACERRTRCKRCMSEDCHCRRSCFLNIALHFATIMFANSSCILLQFTGAIGEHSSSKGSSVGAGGGIGECREH